MTDETIRRRTLLGAEKSVRYHVRRRAFFDGWSRTFNFFVLVLGSGTIYAASNESPILATIVGAVVMLTGAIQLVWDPARNARDHEILARDFSKLLAEIHSKSDPDPAVISNWAARREEIEQAETATYNALEADCRNEVVRVYYEPSAAAAAQQIIPFWPRALMHYVRFENTNFPRKEQSPLTSSVTTDRASASA